MLLWVLLLVIVSVVTANKQRYDGYEVWKITPENEEVVQALYELELDPMVQFWDEQLHVGVPVEVLLPPNTTRAALRRFQDAGVNLESITTDLQKSMDSTRERRTDSGHKTYGKNKFNTYENIMTELERLAEEECPDDFVCETYSIGQSYEGRDLRQLRISGGADRPAVMMDSLIHAREWLAGTTNMRILDRLLTEYGTDHRATYLLHNYDWYFLPVLNPDGYVYTHTDDRFWRKNRNPNNHSGDPAICQGVDLNRNFDAYWGGASTDECSNIYQGESAASEPEVQAMQSAILNITSRQKVIAMWSIHGAIPAFLMPWGAEVDNVCIRGKTFDEVELVANTTADAIEAVYSNTTWRRGGTCEALYSASGLSIDFAQQNGIKYPFTPEVRGPGFDPKPSMIKVSLEECWTGLFVMIKEIEHLEYD